MSKYSKPKRNVNNFNADNFEAEIIQSTSDVLKITSNETQSKIGFYNIPDFHFVGPGIEGGLSNPISNFQSTNSLEKILDNEMRFINSGSYYINLLLNLRPRVDMNLKLFCSNSTLQQNFKILSTVYQQVTWMGLVYFDAGERLEFRILNSAGDDPIIPYGDLRVLNSTLFCQKISSNNVVV